MSFPLYALLFFFFFAALLYTKKQCVAAVFIIRMLRSLGCQFDSPEFLKTHPQRKRICTFLCPILIGYKLYRQKQVCYSTMDRIEE